MKRIMTFNFIARRISGHKIDLLTITQKRASQTQPKCKHNFPYNHLPTINNLNYPNESPVNRKTMPPTLICNTYKVLSPSSRSISSY